MNSVPLSALQPAGPYAYDIPKTYREDMRVPARLYASPHLLEDIGRDRSLWQLVNTAALPGVVGRALAMPDIHEGYGFPIGGVVATDAKTGVISPGGVGYDINCGVRMLVSSMPEKDFAKYAPAFANQVARDVPSGVGRGGDVELTMAEMDSVLVRGAEHLLDEGYATQEDLEATESHGRMEGAKPELISERAKKRGLDQLGTLGSGNHFLEIQAVDEVFDETTASAWGIRKGNVAVFIHCGSRGLGHQTCTDYVRTMVRKLPDWGIELPDKELACAPFASPEGQNYFAAMAAAANFAWANRQMIAFRVRKAWERVLGDYGLPLRQVYDVAHNIAKVETHLVDGKERTVVVHRKGATRAFPGQPVCIPGTMGTSSYVLVGTETAMNETFGSVCHGAGRRMSRHAAKKLVSGQELRKRLHEQGIIVKCPSDSGLSEEGPEAYKDVVEVVDVVTGAGLAKPVARLRPLIVIKGG